ncbi:MAG: SH3 domain-containing protein, partial [Lachnospiraceae bacterium]|nr:SH3 domain-containing protein [Lachnospiraceae bacterium]
TDSKYTAKDTSLKIGDVLLKESSHTAMAVTNGSGSGSSASAPTPVSSGGTLNKSEKWKGKVTTELNVRSWAGTENKVLRVLAKGTKVSVCDTVKASNGKDWYYIKEGGKYGFVSAKYIAR